MEPRLAHGTLNEYVDMYQPIDEIDHDCFRKVDTHPIPWKSKHQSSSTPRSRPESRNCDVMRWPPTSATMVAAWSQSPNNQVSSRVHSVYSRDRFMSLPAVMAHCTTDNTPPSTAVEDGSRCFPFLRLPGEMSMVIYTFRVAHIRPYWDMYYNRFATMSTSMSSKGIVKLLPNLGYVNRQVYFEMVSYLLSDWQVELRKEEDIAYFDKILDYMPISMGYQSVKKVAFTHFSQYANTPTRALGFLDFLKQLPNLDEVLLSMRLDHIHMHNFNPTYRENAFLMGRPIVKTAEQIVASYSLATLCELGKLSKIMIHCEWSAPFYPTARTLNAFFDMQDFLADEFEEAEDVKQLALSEPFHDPRCLAAWRIRIIR